MHWTLDGRTISEAEVTSEGCFVDITLSGLNPGFSQSGEIEDMEWTAQWVFPKGVYSRPPIGTPCVVFVPRGDINNGAYAIEFNSDDSSQLPQAFVDDPDSLHITRQSTAGGIKVAHDSGTDSTAKAAARKDDETTVDSTTDSKFMTWITEVHTIVDGLSSGALTAAMNLAGYPPGTAPTDLSGKISEGSDRVDIGGNPS